MKLIPILFWLPFLMVQEVTLHRWTCTDYEGEVGGQVHRPDIILELVVSGSMVSGKLKVVDNGKIIRISELVGSAFADGSASLSERWVEQSEPAWLPNYNSILITDIRASSFRLNFNSATTRLSKKEKGDIIFHRSRIKPMT